MLEFRRTVSGLPCCRHFESPCGRRSPELREIAVQHPPVWFKSRGALSPTCRGSQVLDSLIKRISVLLNCKAYRRRC